jgi:hypothetical protein
MRSRRPLRRGRAAAGDGDGDGERSHHGHEAEQTDSVRVLIWNLFHGRAVPPAGRPLLAEYATTIAGWEWDVALLQEVPPWWPPMLAAEAGAEHRTELTSRNSLLSVRRAIASRAPDLLKANGGGANAILARAPCVGRGARRRPALRPPARTGRARAHAIARPIVSNAPATVQ